MSNSANIKTPDLKGFREQLGIKQEVERPVVTETPKLLNDEVDLNALATKIRENKKD